MPLVVTRSARPGQRRLQVRTCGRAKPLRAKDIGPDATAARPGAANAAGAKLELRIHAVAHTLSGTAPGS
eukprot:8305044-Alexandrium_andersonii.AAC.1